MITLSDVAKAAGVSPSAVSKALLGGGGKTTRVSEEKVRWIRETAERLGYRPNLIAQRLARKSQDIIGLIVDSQCCYLYSSIMSTIEQQTCQAGYRLQIGLVHDNLDAIKRYVDDFLGYNIQSVICLAHYYDFSEEIPRLFKPFANPIFIGRPMTDEKLKPFLSRRFIPRMIWKSAPRHSGICTGNTASRLKNRRSTAGPSTSAIPRS